MPESTLYMPVLATLRAWLHVSACVLLPLVWGIATELVFRRIAKKHPEPPRDSADRHFLIEYHI